MPLYTVSLAKQNIAVVNVQDPVNATQQVMYLCENSNNLIGTLYYEYGIDRWEFKSNFHIKNANEEEEKLWMVSKKSSVSAGHLSCFIVYLLPENAFEASTKFLD